MSHVPSRQFTEQDQERLTRMTMEAQTLGKENTRLRSENVLLTRELHSYAYMLTKAEMALKFEKVESAMLREALDSLLSRETVISNGKSNGHAHNEKTNGNGHSRKRISNGFGKARQSRPLTNGAG
jgi:hypothetical protein